MKKLTRLLFLMSFAYNLNAQPFTLSVAPTFSNFIYNGLTVGGASGNAKLGFDASFDYITTRDGWFQIGVGLDYQHLNVEIVPAPTGEPVTTHTESVNLLSISFKTVYNLGNYFFLSANPLLDFQLPSESQNSIDNQTGLGLSISGGKRFSLNEKMLLTIEPMLWVHNLIPFVEEGSPKRMTVLGIKFGFTLK